MRRLWKVALVLWVVGALAAPLLAADANTPGESPEAPEPAGDPWSRAVAVIGACFGAALAAAGGGYGVARIGGACIESIARQPEAARDMFAPMVVAAGMVEVGMLFAIVVCLLAIVLQ